MKKNIKGLVSLFLLTVISATYLPTELFAWFNSSTEMCDMKSADCCCSEKKMDSCTCPDMEEMPQEHAPNTPAVYTQLQLKPVKSLVSYAITLPVNSFAITKNVAHSAGWEWLVRTPAIFKITLSYLI